MKKIAILILVLFASCKIAHYEKNRFLIKSVRISGSTCVYAVKFPSMDVFTFNDSCGKFIPGQLLKLTPTNNK